MIESNVFSGSLLKMKSGIIHCSFLDSSGHMMSAGAGNWRDHACSGVRHYKLSKYS